MKSEHESNWVEDSEVLERLQEVDQEYSENEEVGSESDISASVDYSPYLQNIENGVRFNSLALVALILLIGLLKGFKRL